MNRPRTALALLLAAIVVGIAWLALRPASTELASTARPVVSASEQRPAPRELDAPLAESPPPVSESLEHSRPSASESSLSQPSAASEPPSLLLYGFLHPAAGRQGFADEVGISLKDRLGQSQLGKVGTDGAYSFSGLAPGQYWISSGSSQDGAAHAQVEIEAGVSEKRLDLQLALQPEVLVKVLGPDREPITDLDLVAVALREVPGEWLEEFDGSNNAFGLGRFTFPRATYEAAVPKGYIGRIRLDIEPPVFVSLVRYQRVVATKLVARGQSEVVFELDRNSLAVQLASLRFRVVDAETHAPLEKASVVLNSSGVRPLQSKDSVFRADRLPPGWYEVKVYVPGGYSSLDHRIRLEPGSENDLGDLVLERGLWISGKVVDETGHGVNLDVEFAAYDRERGPVRVLGARELTRSDSDGNFKVWGLSRRTYLLSVGVRDKQPWAQCSKVFDTSGGSIENARLELVHGVPLVVRASDADNWCDVHFRILDESGTAVKSTRLWSAEPSPVLLAPGHYVVEVRARGSDEPKRIPITIANSPVELALP